MDNELLELTTEVGNLADTVDQNRVAFEVFARSVINMLITSKAVSKELAIRRLQLAAESLRKFEFPLATSQLEELIEYTQSIEDDPPSAD